MIKVDILFIDGAAAKPYNWETLEEDAIGGSEGSTIRLAEGFASVGHKVVVCQRFDILYSKSPNGVEYVGPHWANIIKPRNVIYVRSKGIWEKFPDSRKFLWLHDASSQDHNNLSEYVSDMVKHKVQAIAVSDWHVTNLLQFAPGLPVKRIYSPMDETCFQPPSDYDKNQLVWMSSPHKGLIDALDVFEKIRQEVPEMKLVVFNPGYYEESIPSRPRVVLAPKVKRKILRSVLSKSLCLFYPTRFEETFGLVAAESNALGTPVACYKVAALAESAAGPFANDPNDLLNQVIAWSKEGRPVVSGQERFRFDRIYPEWREILDL